MSDDLLSAHEEIEELLESYLVDCNSLHEALTYLLVTLQNAEDLVSSRFCSCSCCCSFCSSCQAFFYFHLLFLFLFSFLFSFPSTLPSHFPFPFLFLFLFQLVLKLDTSRNRLLVTNTTLVVYLVAIAFSAYLTGIYGMNLDQTVTIQTVVYGVFEVMFVSSFSLIFIISGCILYYLKRNRIIPKEVFYRRKKDN